MVVIVAIMFVIEPGGGGDDDNNPNCHACGYGGCCHQHWLQSPIVTVGTVISKCNEHNKHAEMQ